MKRLTFAAFVAFWAFVATLLALSAIVPESPIAPAAAAESQDRPIALAEVAEHDSAQSCWLAIAGNVYDVTAYVDRHPAPPAVLLDWCGREATEAMRTKGYGRDHSESAWASLEAMRIGRLE